VKVSSSGYAAVVFGVVADGLRRSCCARKRRRIPGSPAPRALAEREIEVKAVAAREIRAAPFEHECAISSLLKR
jgi:hypothetical protein